jgi:hypothetical protein
MYSTVRFFKERTVYLTLRVAVGIVVFACGYILARSWPTYCFYYNLHNFHNHSASLGCGLYILHCSHPHVGKHRLPAHVVPGVTLWPQIVSIISVCVSFNFGFLLLGINSQLWCLRINFRCCLRALLG